MALGPTQPVTEMNKRNVPGDKRQLAHKVLYLLGYKAV
jgi:hypothetical protein